MRRGVPLTADKEATIIASLQRRSHVSWVAREAGDVSFATVWRVRNELASN
jgi:hypothetical protein